MQCPHCGKQLIQNTGQKVKLRTAILVFSIDGTRCEMPCPKCGGDVEVPVTLSRGAIQNVKPTKVVLTKVDPRT